MGTRTYSRRGANGERVLTQLGRLRIAGGAQMPREIGTANTLSAVPNTVTPENIAESTKMRYNGWSPDWQRAPSPETFIKARNRSNRPGFLSPLVPEDIADHKLFLSADGTVGVAVSPEGDIQNVFNNGGPRGAGTEALLTAIRNGGKTLDCYDGHLPDFYSQFGFVETGRMKFNPEYAPEGWDFERYDNPDVVFMGLKKTGETDEQIRERAADKSKWKTRKISRKIYEGDQWDTAKDDSRRKSRV